METSYGRLVCNFANCYNGLNCMAVDTIQYNNKNKRLLDGISMTRAFGSKNEARNQLIANHTS